MVDKCPKCGADGELLNDIVDGDKVVTECSMCLYHFDDEYQCTGHHAKIWAHELTQGKGENMGIKRGYLVRPKEKKFILPGLL